MKPKEKDFRALSPSFSPDDALSIVSFAKDEDWDSFYVLVHGFAAYYSYKVGLEFFDVSAYSLFCHEFAVFLWERVRRRSKERLKSAKQIVDFLVKEIKRFCKWKWKHVLTDDFQELSSAYDEKEDLAFGMALKKVSGLVHEEAEKEPEYGKKSLRQIMLENCVYHVNSEAFHNLEMSLMLSIRDRKLTMYYIPYVEKVQLLYLLNCCKIEYGLPTIFE